jgi:hypothetical protein
MHASNKNFAWTPLVVQILALEEPSKFLNRAKFFRTLCILNNLWMNPKFIR